MSLLQNEDFALYQLRTAYLTHIKDGVGERLISVNGTVLNNPAFRAGGWAPTHSAEIIKRTYSPPIPTAITSEYFQAPKSTGLHGRDYDNGNDADGLDGEDEGGMVTGGGGSNETVGPGMAATQRERRRRRERRERGEEEDDESSDLSDESDEEGEANARPLTQIKFQKMPLRTRAGSSPLRNTKTDGPSVLVTSPSRPPENLQLRRGSLGALEAVKARARRDTITSSEMSSENELDPSVFRRKQLKPGRPSGRSTHMLAERILEDEERIEADRDEQDPGAESDSSLDSEFAGTVDSNSLLDEDADDMMDSSPPMQIPPPLNTSPKKSKQPTGLLQALPPPRPISVVQPVSALTQAFKAKNKKPESPFQRFAALSGKGDPSPLWIKIYFPFAKSSKPLEMPIRRNAEDGSRVSVADAIGLALWRYVEEGFEPSILAERMDVNKWVLRMFEDDEVEFDFPAITRTKPIIDFASNNTRPARGRMRDKPWDEFAVVEANEIEQKENLVLTPQYTTEAKKALESSSQTSTPVATPVSTPTQLKPPTRTLPPAAARFYRNPITGPSFGAGAARTLADAPVASGSQATPRMGAPRTVTLYFTNEQLATRTLPINATTDTYIAELFDRACREFNVDKALYVLKVRGTNTMAPFDRTIEALGSRLELDLARRRFITDGAFGLSGSPGSESPGAPLLINHGSTPKKGKKAIGVGSIHPLAQKHDAFLTGLTSTSNYKRYFVTRKQPMSFSSSSSRILALDGEYMHIMPANLEKGGANNTNPTGYFLEAGVGKTTTVHFSSVVGSKVSRRHLRMFRVVVYKERETKRYDFEAQTREEAAEIVREVKKGVEKFQESGF